MHILSPETDNRPSWISGRERMTVENISWSISTKEFWRLRRELNPRPPGFQSDGASNWATEAGLNKTKPPIFVLLCVLCFQRQPVNEYEARAKKFCHYEASLVLSPVYFKMLHCTWMVCWIANDTRLFRANCLPTDRVISNWNRGSHIHWPIYLSHWNMDQIKRQTLDWNS